MYPFTQSVMQSLSRGFSRFKIIAAKSAILFCQIVKLKSIFPECLVLLQV